MDKHGEEIQKEEVELAKEVSNEHEDVGVDFVEITVRKRARAEIPPKEKNNQKIRNNAIRRHIINK